MIFRPELVKLIMQGKKTQTRRPAKTTTCRYEPGKAYALQPGRGKRAVAHITIGEVRIERVGDLTLKDAKREGFVTTQEFFDYWRGLYGTVDEDQMVWVISFQLGDRTDTPRLLAARPGGPGGDYTSNPHLAVSDEPEALGEADLANLTKLARARDQMRSNDPLQASRQKIARELELMQYYLERDTNADVMRTVRRLEQELRVLDRKLAV